MRTQPSGTFTYAQPFRMGEYWYATVNGRLIRCESYESACDLMYWDEEDLTA